MTRSVTDAHIKGVAYLVREADKEGLVVLERAGNKVAIVIPLTIPGFSRCVELIQKIRESNDPELLAYGEQLGLIIEAKNVPS